MRVCARACVCVCVCETMCTVCALDPDCALCVGLYEVRPQLQVAALLFSRKIRNELLNKIPRFLFSYGDEDASSDGDDSEDYGESEDEEYEDDDEMSDEEDDENWKVRRSAIRTLTAVVEASKHDPSSLWLDQFVWRKNSEDKITVSGALVNRFKER